MYSNPVFQVDYVYERLAMHKSFVTPAGEELIVLPYDEFVALQDALEGEKARRIMAEIAGGQQEALSHEEVLAALDAPTPLAFWRKKRKMTQAALAATVGVSQSYIASLEAGERKGDPALFLRLARALHVKMESLVEEGANGAQQE